MTAVLVFRLRAMTAMTRDHGDVGDPPSRGLKYLDLGFILFSQTVYPIFIFAS